MASTPRSMGLWGDHAPTRGLYPATGGCEDVELVVAYPLDPDGWTLG